MRHPAFAVLVMALAGCGGGRPAAPQRTTPPPQPAQPTKDRPIVFRKTDQGVGLVFGGETGAIQKVLRPQRHSRFAISPSHTWAVSLTFHPQTEARVVTFYDRSGDVTANVLLPAMPDEARKRFFHDLRVVVSDEPLAAVELDHQPYVDVVLAPDKYPPRCVEWFLVDPAGKVQAMPVAKDERVQPLLPAGAGLALLRIRPVGPKVTAKDWTLERYVRNDPEAGKDAPAFKRLWTRTGKAHGVYPARAKYDVSLSVNHLSPQAVRYQYLHFKADGTLERQSLQPTTSSRPTK